MVHKSKIVAQLATVAAGIAGAYLSYKNASAPWILTAFSASGVCACWAVWELANEHVAALDETMQELAPHLDMVDAYWRPRARAAGWPPNLREDTMGGLAGWCRIHGNRLEARCRDALEIGRSFYAGDQAVGVDATRRKARIICDWLAGFGGAFSVLRSYLEREVNPEAVIMLAYLELAAAEKNAKRRMTPGKITKWIRLGEQWPKLCKRESDTGLPPVALNVVSGYLDPNDELTELGVACVRMAMHGAWGRRFSIQQLFPLSSGSRLDDAALFADAIGKVYSALLMGVITALGEREGELTKIPASHWRHVRLDATQDGGRWVVRIVEREGEPPASAQQVTGFDRVMVNSIAFQEQWPSKWKEFDEFRRFHVEHAKAAGVDPTILARLAD